ncbi:hypothetical protein LINPERHAP1_LOCUS31596 [Linum perenne]
MKLVRILVSRLNELWAQVLISKYMVRTENGYMLARQKGFSSVWRGIMKAWSDTHNGVDSSLSVSDFCLNNGSWDLPKLKEVLPENVVWQVYGMSPPREELGADKMVWGLEKDGRFLVNSAYNMLMVWLRVLRRCHMANIFGALIGGGGSLG